MKLSTGRTLARAAFKYEFGSPKRPKTLEAVILNFIDDLDSKINGVRTHLDKEPDSESAWTQYHRLYDRYFFKGFGEPTTAPQEAAAPPVAAAAAASRPGPVAEHRAPFNNALEAKLRGVTPNLFRMRMEIHQIFKDVVLKGIYAGNGMASFSDVLSEADADAIHAYLIHHQRELYLKEQARK